jgi:hypothetical protein
MAETEEKPLDLTGLPNVLTTTPIPASGRRPAPSSGTRKGLILLGGGCVVMALGVGVAGAIVPAWKAARQEP